MTTNGSSPALLLNPSLPPPGAGGAAGTGSTAPHTSSDTTTAIRSVHVHPLVLLAILDHHTRRQENAGRVIGTLLGRRHDDATGIVEVTNCFAVPHAEHGDEVAIGKDFNRQMLALHTRANRNEVVVGWYATALPPQSSAPGGDDGDTAAAGDVSEYKCIADTSSLIHEFYAGECGAGRGGAAAAVAGGIGLASGDPVHLVLDTSLQYDTVALRAYKSTPVTVRGEPFANMFHEIEVRIRSGESERICVDKMVRSLGAGSAEDCQGTNGNKAIGGDVSDETDDPAKGLQASMSRLLELLDTASDYVDKIVDGSIAVPADGDALGRKLYDAMASVPRVREETFDDMFHDNLQDLLMVSYLSNLTKTQLVIAEKLNETLTLGI